MPGDETMRYDLAELLRRRELTEDAAAQENAAALNAAALFELDDVIDPAETRGVIAATLAAVRRYLLGQPAMNWS